MQPHTWSFARIGGFDQVQIKTSADLYALKYLDQKLWVALGCPTRGIEFDAQTLDFIDTDKDKHIRANDVLAALTWTEQQLTDLEILLKPTGTLPLSVINTTQETGQQILASAKHVLKTLDKTDANEISLADVLSIEQKIAEQACNGDGVICPKNIADETLQAAVNTIIECVGSKVDLSGEAGLDSALLQQFFSEVEANLAWHQLATPEILPLGEQTAAAYDALNIVRDKINDYFTRCQLASYDARAAEPLNRTIADYAAFAAASLSPQSGEIANFPLATIAADKPLPLLTGINPAWYAALVAFRTQVITPLLGEMQTLSYTDWQSIYQRFEAFAAWQAQRPDNKTATLSVEQLNLLLPQKNILEALIQQDLAVAQEVSNIHQLEKILRFQRDLFSLLNNFVSFRDFYSGERKAIFQVGTLYLDGRSCDLCLKVDDVNKHAGFANSSGVCLVYCECVRASETMKIVAAFTAGDSDYLVVGRNGIFYDAQGKDWDATIVRILDHPISLRQAFWFPYKKLVSMISEQLQKLVSAKVGSVDEKLSKLSADAVKPITAAPATPTPAPDKPPFDVGKFAGIFAAIGLAMAAIGGMVTSIVTSLLALKIWQIPLAFLGLMLLISGPSVILAWFKLKRRNLAPILDANGWAINARVRINIPFGTSLTALARLPSGAQSSLIDPYAEKRNMWPALSIILLIVITALAWYQGWLK